MCMDICRCSLNAMATLEYDFTSSEMKQFLLEIMLGSNYDIGTFAFNKQLRILSSAIDKGFIDVKIGDVYKLSEKGLEYVSMC